MTAEKECTFNCSPNCCPVIEQIDIADIDLCDETYRISSHSDISDLALSIESLDLLRPPILIMCPTDDSGNPDDSDDFDDPDNPDDSGNPDESDDPDNPDDRPRYLIISGFRRIKAMKHNGRKSFPCQISDQSRKKSAAAAIMENAFQRELSPMEQVRAVCLLKKTMDMDSDIIANHSRTIFNTRMNASFVDKLLDVGTMPSVIHHLLEQNRISLTAVLKLKGYDSRLKGYDSKLKGYDSKPKKYDSNLKGHDSKPKEYDSSLKGYDSKLKGYGSGIQEAVASLFAKIKISSSKQNEIITNLYEIAARENLSVQEVLTTDDIKQIINNNDMDENRKGNLIRSALYERRYPELSRAKNRFARHFKQMNKELNLKGELKLEPPMNFEARNYTFSLEFRDVEELQRKVDKLSAVSKNPLIREIISCVKPH